MGRPFAGMFSDHVIVTMVAALAVATTLAGAAGIGDVVTDIWLDGIETSCPVSCASISK